MILSLIVYTGTGTMLAGLGWHVSSRVQRVMAKHCSEMALASWEILVAILS